MSKTYTCRVKKDLSEKVREEDRVVYRLRPLPVAPREKMTEWIREALLEDGAIQDRDGILHLEMDGVRVEVDLEKDEVRLIAESEEGVRVERDEEREVYNWADSRDKAQQDAENLVAQELEEDMRQAAAEARQRVRLKAARILKEAEEAVKTRIRKVENKAIVRGLDEKARDLGEVMDTEESHEPEGESRIVWRIRLA